MEVEPRKDGLIRSLSTGVLGTALRIEGHDTVLQSVSIAIHLDMDCRLDLIFLDLDLDNRARRLLRDDLHLVKAVRFLDADTFADFGESEIEWNGLHVSSRENEASVRITNPLDDIIQGAVLRLISSRQELL